LFLDTRILLLKSQHFLGQDFPLLNQLQKHLLSLIHLAIHRITASKPIIDSSIQTMAFILRYTVFQSFPFTTVYICMKPAKSVDFQTIVMRPDKEYSVWQNYVNYAAAIGIHPLGYNEWLMYQSYLHPYTVIAGNNKTTVIWS
jgi:hypothetical protein